MAAYTRSILEPLVARLTQQETIIRGQAETVGSLRAQLAAAEEWIGSLEALQSPTDARETAEAPDPPSEPSEPPPAPSPVSAPIPPRPNGSSPSWRRWWAALVGA